MKMNFSDKIVGRGLFLYKGVYLLLLVGSLYISFFGKWGGQEFAQHSWIVYLNVIAIVANSASWVGFTRGRRAFLYFERSLSVIRGSIAFSLFLAFLRLLPGPLIFFVGILPLRNAVWDPVLSLSTDGGLGGGFLTACAGALCALEGSYFALLGRGFGAYQAAKERRGRAVLCL